MRDFDAISRRYSLDRRECGGVISIWAIGSTLNLLLSAKRIGWLLRLPEAMKPSAECERLADMLREKATEIEDAERKAQYEYLVRSLLRLAREFEQDKYRIAPSPRKDRAAA